MAKALSAGQKNVTDMESLICLMRSPDLTLAGRSDLSLIEVESLQQYEGRHPTAQFPLYQHNVKEVM